MERISHQWRVHDLFTRVGGGRRVKKGDETGREDNNDRVLQE
jgi:hypothetical protein